MELLFASSNPHKIDEVRAILADVGVETIGLPDLPGASLIGEPRETGATFAENARIKALHYAAVTGRRCLADDSGLEVDALGGQPGVRSARWAGAGGSRAGRDEANNRKLLAALDGVPPDRRTARFVCAMCLADPDGSVLAESSGTMEGLIADRPAGANGFGYDPLLYLPDAGCTSAELSPMEKNARSHRGRAARAMAEALRGRG